MLQLSQSNQIHNPGNTNRHPFSNPHKKGRLRYQHLNSKHSRVSEHTGVFNSIFVYICFFTFVLPVWPIPKQ